MRKSLVLEGRRVGNYLLLERYVWSTGAFLTSVFITANINCQGIPSITEQSSAPKKEQSFAPKGFRTPSLNEIQSWESKISLWFNTKCASAIAFGSDRYHQFCWELHVATLVPNPHGKEAEEEPSLGTFRIHLGKCFFERCESVWG